ncbi:MAG TPA: hypothetical protein VFO65_01490 [Acidimicrobiales bacterium]|nr:hypothetical protein [Acidimicrobiales bacterium]
MNEDLARRGVEHLQAAATEMIAALRAFADLAEELVREVAGPAAPAGPATRPEAAADSSVTRIPVS